MKVVELLTHVRKARDVVLVSHQNSDIDAVLSCHALSHLIREVNPEAHITIASIKLSLPAKRLLEDLGLIDSTEETATLPRYDLCFFIDVNNPAHLGELEKAVDYHKPIIIVDHHRPSAKRPQNVVLTIMDQEAVATAEIVCDIYRAIDLKPPKEVAFWLLIGILSDSRRLYVGGLKTLLNVAFLVECGASLEEASRMLYMPLSYSEKIARLKSAQRLKLFTLGDQWVLATSHVGSYEASAARALVDLGADLAAVYNDLDSRGSRLCARASEGFTKSFGLHLGEVMEQLGLEFSGSGGGHATAACVTTPVRGDVVLEGFLRFVKDKLKQPFKEIT